jgi:Tfp pilus assembly protein PilF
MMMVPILLAWAAVQVAAPIDRETAVPAHEERQAVEPFIARGLVLYRQLHFRAAQKAFEEAVAADPSNAAAHFYLGYTLYKIAEPTRRLTPEKVQAREEFARCFDLDRSFRPTWP